MKVGKLQLIKRVSGGLIKKGLKEEQVKQVVEQLFLVIKQSLANQEDIVIKDCFTIKRKKQAKSKTGKEKHCEEHRQIMEAHKGDMSCCGTSGAKKTVVAYSKCLKFRELRNGIKKCGTCRAKRNEMEKSRITLPGITFHATGSFMKELVGEK
jgi:nucleoid DNA-binding protein